MRILVISDSHGAGTPIELAIEAQPNAEYVLFLGDGVEQFEEVSGFYPAKKYLKVRGNCDYNLRLRETDLLVIENHRIFFTHGHIYDVKNGLDNLKAAARARNADIVLFGHTHVALTDYEDGLYMMNPGSIAKPRHGQPTYGIVDITNAGVVLNIVEIKRQP